MTNLTAPHLTQIVLPRMGQAPLCFTGALLVEASVGSICNAQGGLCRISIYEMTDGFAAQIALETGAQGACHSFVRESKDPSQLRDWIAAFDPVTCVDVSDILAQVQGEHSADEAALAEAAHAIEARIEHMRAAYVKALNAAFGQSGQAAMAA